MGRVTISDGLSSHCEFAMSKQAFGQPAASAGRTRLDGVADPATYRPAPGSVPDSPGVYRFRDEHGRVIYVGKAKSLRSRLGSYFQDLANLHPRTQTMVR